MAHLCRFTMIVIRSHDCNHKQLVVVSLCMCVMNSDGANPVHFEFSHHMPKDTQLVVMVESLVISV